VEVIERNLRPSSFTPAAGHDRRTTRPDQWDTYPEMTTSVHQASDHAAVTVHLDL
jgi:hypothetical protein